MSRAAEDFAESHSLGRAVGKRRSRRGWLVAYGALCALFGAMALALVEASSLAVVLLIALILIVAGGAEILRGFKSRDWPGNRLIIPGILFGVDLVFMVPTGSRSASGCGADGIVDRRAPGLYA
jgi:uncharacterized membrane protein HdeD (DUF308 family)